MADPGDTQDGTEREGDEFYDDGQRIGPHDKIDPGGTEREGLDTEAIAAPREPEWGDVDLPDWLSYWADDVCEKAPYPDHGYAPTQRVMGYVRWLEARVFVDYTDTDEELAMATARIKDLEAEWADKLDFIEAALGRAEAERDEAGVANVNNIAALVHIEARAERYEKALREIVRGSSRWPASIAKAVLEEGE